MPQCLFCASTRLTREHVWPDWVVRLFKAHSEPRHGLYTRIQTIHERPVASRPVSTITERARLVCGPCNWNWMSQLEAEAMAVLVPLLQDVGASRRFSPLDHVTIAAWLTLRSMIWDALKPKGEHSYYTATERRAFCDTLTPPADTRIWLAPFIGKPQSVHFNVINYVEQGGPYGVHSVTGAVHELAFQLVTWRGHRKIIKTRKMNVDGWDDVSRRIWPAPRRVVNWPPAKALDDGGFEAFKARWRKSSPDAVRPFRSSTSTPT